MERSAEQQLGHGVLHLGADHAAQGPRAVERVEALVRDALDRRVLDRQRDAERRGALHGGLEHPPRNGRNVRAAQTAEHHGRVDAVEKFRLEGRPQLSHNRFLHTRKAAVAVLGLREAELRRARRDGLRAHV